MGDVTVFGIFYKNLQNILRFIENRLKFDLHPILRDSSMNQSKN